MNFMFEILFLPREHKIHIFEPTCNVLFIIWRRERETISTKAKGGNRDVIERYDIRKIHTYIHTLATRVPGEVAYGIYEWFSSQ